MLESPGQDEPAAESPVVVDDASGKGTMVLGVVALVAIVAAFALLAYALLPDHVEAAVNAGWVTMIVANRWLIWLIRMLVLVGLLMFMVFAVYFIRSIVVRIQLGHWLRRGGPFEAEVFDRAEHELADVQWVFQALSEADAA